MYGLNVQQPHASLLLSGIKKIECRNYPIPKNLIGKRIAIRATTYHKMSRIDESNFYFKLFSDSMYLKSFPTKSIIGTVVLDSCKKYTTINEFGDDINMHKNLLSWFNEDRWGWKIREATKFNKPLPSKKNPGGIIWCKDIENKIPGILEAFDE